MVTWIAAGIAVIAVTVACWQLVRTHGRMRAAARLADRVGELTEATEEHAEQAEREAQQARSQARWAWEQVKLATAQLEQARGERRASAQAEQWEWAYALTHCSRELVDASQELVRIALDQQVAPHYRLAALRHYQQASGRWQDTMAKALARTEPTLEVQHQVLTFGQVQHRLHGQVGVLLRAAETGMLSETDPLARQMLGAGQELETARRQLQRTLSATLTKPGTAPGPGNSTGTDTGRDVTDAPPPDSERPTGQHQVTTHQRGDRAGNNDPKPEQTHGSAGGRAGPNRQARRHTRVPIPD